MFEEAKRDAAIANRLLTEFGLATGQSISVGHASLRVPGHPDRFVVKGRGYKMDALAAIRPEDMVVCDLDGYLVEGPPGVTQCFEVMIHACMLKKYPNIQLVVHVHPQFAVLMGSVRAQLRPLSNGGGRLVRKPLPVFPHSYLVQSEQDGNEVADLAAESKVVLLRGHGAVSTGASLEDAVMTMCQLEEQAKLNWYAHAAFGKDFDYVEESMFLENESRERLEDLPHFKASMNGQRPIGHGVWNYYSESVSKDL